MLNTQKLIYLLPDVTYIAELLPTKKEHTFAIQTFRQINGEFLNEEDELIAANCAKLLNKIEAEEYQLVLPDFLFTNTIVTINETSESKVKEEIKDKLLPQLNLDKDTHDVQTFIVTQHGGKSKVQISALEKSVLEAFRVPAEKQGVKITGVYPLSWTIKSIVSLEPSISVIQIGTRLYSALHYIGVDQCTSQSTGEVTAIAETIKTLKGAEPSIQTVYLLTNQLVEQELKKEVSDTLPLQQLTTNDEEQTDLPSYVKQIIESGLRTLSIPDFPVPKFPLGKILGILESKEADTTPEATLPTAKATLQAIDIFEETETESANEEVSTKTPAEASEEETSEAETELPAPTPPALVTETVPDLDLTTSSERDSLDDNLVSLEITEKTEIEATISEPLIKDPFANDEPEESPEPDLSQFAAKPLTQDVLLPDTSDEASHTETRVTPLSKQKIKNKAQNKSLVKMLAVTLVVFLVTVGVGVGIGFALLSITSKAAPQPTPVASATPEPTPITTATPTPAPEIDRSEYSVLVVNATTVSGLAGKYQRALQTAGYDEVAAGNAKGEYESGEIYVLLGADTPGLLEILEKDSGLSLSADSDTDKTTEDARNQYDAVIVIADEETD